jgi:hypothetical protein
LFYGPLPDRCHPSAKFRFGPADAATLWEPRHLRNSKFTQFCGTLAATIIFMTGVSELFHTATMAETAGTRAISGRRDQFPNVYLGHICF